MRDTVQMRNGIILVAALLGACGSSSGAEMMGTRTDGGGEQKADGAPPADARAVQRDTSTAADLAPMGTDAFISHDAQASPKDAAPSYLYCPQLTQPVNSCLTPSGMYYRDDAGAGDQYGYGIWKDGHPVMVCQGVTGCLMASQDSSDVLGNTPNPAPFLCVKACTDGCYRDRGATCRFSAPCCAPLTCGADGTCQ